MITNYEVRGLDINMSLVEVVHGLGTKNIVDGIKILKVKFGISYCRLAKMLGINRNSVMMALRFGTFDGLISEIKLLRGIEQLQCEFLGTYPTQWVEEPEATQK